MTDTTTSPPTTPAKNVTNKMNDKMNIDEPPLTDRAARVLKKLIGLYIRDGAPIGSRTLAHASRLALSPATIRNVMADLETHGFITAPHACAGRVPTQKGYRFFIDDLLKAETSERRTRGAPLRRIEGDDQKSIITGAAEMLSRITSFAGIVSTPGARCACIRQVEFLRIKDARVLAILVTEDGQVQNRILSTTREYGDSELIDAANYFNATYASRTLRSVRAELRAHLRRDRRSMHREMRTAISIAHQLLDDESNDAGVQVAGEDNLLSIPEFGELEKLRGLFDAFKTKQVLFDLLHKSMLADGVNILIGEESGHRILRDCSIIAAPYRIDNQNAGVLGVIGPTRMNYDEVICAVDNTAKLLGDALSARH